MNFCAKNPPHRQAENRYVPLLYQLMRTFNLLFLFGILAFGGCANSNQETNDDTAQSSSESQIPLDSTPFAVGNIIPPISKEKYTVSCYNLCDNGHGILLNMDTMSKYGKYNPYRFSNKTRDDSTVVQFDFITDCCATFTGEVALKKDTLYLSYYFDRDTMVLCDCYCDYRMTYRINKADLRWSAIEIVHGKPRKI